MLNSHFSMGSSSSVMAPFFANQSCDPWTPASRQCTLGNYVSYSVNATSPADITETVNFARQHNIRLVIRNTGHEYVQLSSHFSTVKLLLTKQIATMASQLVLGRWRYGLIISSPPML